jgi:hypothetical protein
MVCIILSTAVLFSFGMDDGTQNVSPLALSFFVILGAAAG